MNKRRRGKSEAFVPFYIVLFMLSVGILLNFVVPPFQNPDEPQHFGTILTYSLGNEKKGVIEKEIIEIMDKNNWWKYVGMARWGLLPEKITKIDYLMGYYSYSDFTKRLDNVIFYHFLSGKVLGIFFKENIVSSYYFCRLISFLLIMGSLFLIFSTLKIISNYTNHYLSYGIFLVIFLPQFCILSISVNSDSLSLFLSSLFFFASFSLILGKLRIGYFLLLFMSAVLGFLTDRSIFCLILLAVLVPFFLIKRKNYKNSIILMLTFFLVFIILIYVLVQLFPIQVDNSLNAIKINYKRSLSSIPKIFSLSAFNRQFFSVIADSFLLKFGWMAFGAHKIFYYIWRILILSSFAGIIIWFVRFIGLRVKKSLDGARDFLKLKIVIFSIVAILFQVFGLWAFYGTNKSFVQGRYFFPVIIPVVFLFLLGLKSLFDLFHRKGGVIAICVLIVFEFMLLNYTVWNYVIPVFHLMIKSPQAGI